MDDRGDAWEQPPVWRALDDQGVLISAHIAQPAPAGGDHGSRAHRAQGLGHRPAQPRGIGADAASEADVHGRRTGRNERLQLRIHRRLAASVAKPVSGGDRIGWPIAWRRDEAGAVAIQSPRRPGRVPPSFDAEVFLTPAANQARVGTRQHSDQAVAQAIQKAAEIAADHGRKWELARRRQHRDRERLDVRNAEPLGDVWRSQRLVMSDDYIRLPILYDGPAVLEHSLHDREDVVANRQLLAARFRYEGLEVSADRRELDSVAGSEPLKAEVRRERDLVTAFGEPRGKRSEWLHISGAASCEYDDPGHVTIPFGCRVLSQQAPSSIP
jgi:hypothetical protein